MEEDGTRESGTPRHRERHPDGNGILAFQTLEDHDYPERRTLNEAGKNECGSALRNLLAFPSARIRLSRHIHLQNEAPASR